MDFIDQLHALASKIQKLKDDVKTEEATKNAFVLPFIHALGYDIFNPTEVIPEFTADVGIKKGEKVDYAIMLNGKAIILFECKKCSAKLDRSVASQLYRYFSVTEARIGILTDGITYQFFSDLDEPNKLDEKPFMEFSFMDVNEALVPELKKLTKSSFDLDAAIAAASELKYTKEIRRIIGDEFGAPSDEFLRFVLPRVYPGKMTQRVLDQFRDVVKRALHQFVADRINERIKSALSNEGTSVPAAEEGRPLESAESTPPVPAPKLAGEVITTTEELEAYFIVKSILREVVEPKRVVGRDGVSYFSVLIDDTNRKPVCRLYFNRARKQLGLLDAAKVEHLVPIDSLNDIFAHSEHLKETALRYVVREEGAHGHAAATDDVADSGAAALPHVVPSAIGMTGNGAVGNGVA